MSRIAAWPVAHIAAVDGWSLCYEDVEPHGRWHEYVAVRGDELQFLGVSRFFFTPSQDRFAWLVRGGFPSTIRREGGCHTPITDNDIDAALSQQVAA